MITRDLSRAARSHYDIIVIGGGIYGACLALEASKSGRHALLLERADFGAATSANCLGVIHGGFRYLQHLDFGRFHESVRERRWFLRTFPDLVAPLKCLMPLYGVGVRRRDLFRIGLLANDLLSCRRNLAVRVDRHLPSGRLLSRDATIAEFPFVDRDGLVGSGCWYDAAMRSPSRVLIEILRWACACGATAMNYVEAVDLVERRGQVIGVRVKDRQTGYTDELNGTVVVNCAGPWCRQLAGRFRADHPRLFKPSLAFNVLIDHPPLSKAAVAVAPKRPGGRTYFLLPHNSQVLAGTFHAPWDGDPDRPIPKPSHLAAFLDDLRCAIPGFNADSRDVVRVYAGLLPARSAGSTKLVNREVIVDHARLGGPRGLYSVSGVKFTTARKVAGKLLGRIFDQRKPAACTRNDGPPGMRAWTDVDLASSCCGTPGEADTLRAICREEAVVHLDDLLLRRLHCSDRTEELISTGRRVCGLLGWSAARSRRELARLHNVLLKCGHVASRDGKRTREGVPLGISGAADR